MQDLEENAEVRAHPIRKQGRSGTVIFAGLEALESLPVITTMDLLQLWAEFGAMAPVRRLEFDGPMDKEAPNSKHGAMRRI